MVHAWTHANWFGLAERRKAGKQKDLGSTPFQLSLRLKFSSNVLVYGHRLCDLALTMSMKHSNGFQRNKGALTSISRPNRSIAATPSHWADQWGAEDENASDTDSHHRHGEKNKSIRIDAIPEQPPR